MIQASSLVHEEIEQEFSSEVALSQVSEATGLDGMNHSQTVSHSDLWPWRDLGEKLLLQQL